MKKAIQEAITLAKAAIANGCNTSDLLSNLKAESYPATEAIKVIREACGMSLGQAKEALSVHPAWQQSVTDAQELHDDFQQAIDTPLP